MSHNIIEFPSNNKPDENHTYTDENGVRWFEFLCSYFDDNEKQFSFSIWAMSHTDAEERLCFITKNSKVDGQLYAEVDY